MLISPAKTVRGHVCSFETENKKLLKRRGCPFHQALLRFIRFLDRMLVFAAVRRKGALTLVRSALGRVVDTDDPHADWICATRIKLIYLFPQVVNHAVNLLDHGLEQDFDFDSDLYRCNRTSANYETRVLNGINIRDDLTEATVTTTSLNALPQVLSVQYGDSGVDTFDQVLGATNRVQVS